MARGYGRIAMGLRDFSVENAAEASDIPINICWNVGIDALQTMQFLNFFSNPGASPTNWKLVTLFDH